MTDDSLGVERVEAGWTVDSGTRFEVEPDSCHCVATEVTTFIYRQIA